MNQQERWQLSGTAALWTSGVPGEPTQSQLQAVAVFKVRRQERIDEHLLTERPVTFDPRFWADDAEEPID